jgi:hypothetical protein
VFNVNKLINPKNENFSISVPLKFSSIALNNPHKRKMILPAVAAYLRKINCLVFMYLLIKLLKKFSSAIARSNSLSEPRFLEFQDVPDNCNLINPIIKYIMVQTRVMHSSDIASCLVMAPFFKTLYYLIFCCLINCSNASRCCLKAFFPFSVDS